MRLTLLISLFILTTGCDMGAKRIKPPKIDASSAAKQAMSLFDTNSDGALADDELKASPGIASALATIDGENGDGKVSEDELQARISTWLDSNAGSLPATLSITMSGKPVDEATVTLEPEPFLEGAVAPASGKTDYSGMVELSCEAVPGGIQVGLYRIKISKMKDGKETIPPKYNSETELGIEIYSASPAVSTTMGQRIQLKK